MQTLFGAGAMWGTPLTDAVGNPVSNPTPVRFGVAQEISIDIDFSTKELYGTLQFPVAVGRGTAKISGNIKNAQINGRAWASLFFGQSMTTGIFADVLDTTGSLIPMTGPYTITPTVPGSGTWAADLGVLDTNGNPMQVVASAPASGQYSVSAGVYTFAAADDGKRVFINFQYTGTSTTAPDLLVTSQPLGYTPTFALDVYLPYQGSSVTAHLFNAVASKLAIQTKLDDFVIPQMDYTAFADAQNRVMQIGTSQ
ncbi:hypothetical protein BGV65_12300 [Burkholderia ubonensis]|uniref:hypothetical protein n=2 Tax=Burkholderia ubonensis TaxID=101571 RepID=UPI0007C6A6B0|nr:hypothetical protein [Burkholderia ubonensis]ODQ34557.1 hypothetical protein BGV65_12300 [Burkholderia ubonensis]